MLRRLSELVETLRSFDPACVRTYEEELRKVCNELAYIIGRVEYDLPIVRACEACGEEHERVKTRWANTHLENTLCPACVAELYHPHLALCDFVGTLRVLKFKKRL